MKLMEIISPDDLHVYRIAKGDRLQIKETSNIETEGVYALMTNEGLIIRSLHGSMPVMQKGQFLSAIIGRVEKIIVDV